MLFLIKQVDPEILSSVQSNLSDKPEDLNTAAILIISFIYSVIAAPVVEEFIFRGILMGRLYNKYGIGKAILFSSIIFFIMHLTINPMILLLGISCALLAYKYKSIIPSIALHACNNLLVFVTGLDKSSSGSNPLNINTSVTIAGIILLLIYAFYSYLNYKKCRSML
jgi:membrane protease YdiL (CAAX protease family)